MLTKKWEDASFRFEGMVELDQIYKNLDGIDHIGGRAFELGHAETNFTNALESLKTEREEEKRKLKVLVAVIAAIESVIRERITSQNV